MIIVRLSGGLGNQLFQYAIGRRLAIQHKTSLLLEDSFYVKTPHGVTPRTYELDRYPIVARRTTNVERMSLWFYSSRFIRFARRYVHLPGKFFYIRENINQFNTEALNLPNNVFLDGYWQSERYFFGVNDVLRAELQPKLPMSQEDIGVVQKIQSCKSVSLHIRRGDYIGLSSAYNHHGLCGLDYYKQAVEYFANTIIDPVFFIFSDDLDWAKDNLHLNYPAIFVGHNSSHNAFQDLRLMSLTNHQIIANSSFSWWSAWLNPDREKIIIRPKKWLANEDNSWTCPRDWIAL